jgi:hypothetical protein
VQLPPRFDLSRSRRNGFGSVEHDNERLIRTML